MSEIPAPWDAYVTKANYDGRPLEPANDVPDPLILWALSGVGWTWPQYVAWAKVHPRHDRHAPPL